MESPAGIVKKNRLLYELRPYQVALLSSGDAEKQLTEMRRLATIERLFLLHRIDIAQFSGAAGFTAKA
ncbi:hypothetical protein JXA32_15060 [Candidatus Sumerlaeota bacterium]|nr:hypothetical protein [Candidatus Sumerlaeota bacterium]